jgi:hypothetical protein
LCFPGLFVSFLSDDLHVPETYLGFVDLFQMTGMVWRMCLWRGWPRGQCFANGDGYGLRSDNGEH